MKKQIQLILFILTLTVSWLGAASDTFSADEAVGTTTFSWTPGVRGVVEVAGTFGSGTIILHRWVGSGTVESGNGEWVAFDGASFTDDGGIEFVTSSNRLSVSVSGSTTPTIYFQVINIKN